MTDFHFRRLEQYQTGGTGNHMMLSIPAPTSPSGKVYRCCPAPDCTPSLFQLGNPPSEQTIAEWHLNLIRRPPKTPGITCPYCGYDGPDSEFTFRGDLEAAKEYIAWAARQDIHDHLVQMASDFNRRTQNAGRNFISVKMEVKSSSEPEPFVWREDLLRDLTCDICGRRYGVYAVALFCPDCGARNIHVHFGREVELIRQQVELAGNIEREGKEELAYRLLGNAHEDVLTAFETYLKTTFRFLVKSRLPQQAIFLGKKATHNRFQNIERGQELFAKIRENPYKGLDEDDLKFLRLNIEKRHIVGHNLGIADEGYSEVSQTEEPGQTVRLLADEVSRFAELCRRVIVSLEEKCPEFLPPKHDIA